LLLRTHKSPPLPAEIHLPPSSTLRAWQDERQSGGYQYQLWVYTVAGSSPDEVANFYVQQLASSGPLQQAGWEQDGQPEVGVITNRVHVNVDAKRSVNGDHEDRSFFSTSYTMHGVTPRAGEVVLEIVINTSP
jgi:hypothetical protein